MVLPDYRDYPVIDCHIHFGHPHLKDSLMGIMDQFSIDRLNIVCTPDQTRLSLVPDALHLKSFHQTITSLLEMHWKKHWRVSGHKYWE